MTVIDLFMNRLQNATVEDQLDHLQHKLHKIAAKIHNDLVEQLKLPDHNYYDTFSVLYRVLAQEHEDKNKIYSIHELKQLVL